MSTTTKRLVISLIAIALFVTAVYFWQPKRDPNHSPAWGEAKVLTDEVWRENNVKTLSSDDK